jgi:multidrug resistance efflux pump
VDVTWLGRGSRGARGPPQILATQVGGAVTSVAVVPGDRVVRGQEIARLESTTTAAALLEADRKLELAQRGLVNFRNHKKDLYVARKHHLLVQSETIRRRAASEVSSVARMASKTRSVEALKQAGLATGFESIDSAERLAGMHRGALRVQEEAARISEEIAALDAEVGDEEWRLTLQVEEAQAQHDSLKFALEAAIVRTPSDGIVGSISVRPGDPLAPGAPLGSVVAAGAPRSVVVYIPERDRAFLEKGAAVRVEVDQLPAWEFGALHGRITRIASEIASERDLRDTLGDQGRLEEPMYRVDIALEADAAYLALKGRLRPESLTSVRFSLRQRRIITILFEPLYRWLR